MSLNVSIIGAGWMGRTHALAVDTVGDNINKVIDPDLKKAETLSNKYGCTCDSRLEAARNSDVAIITSPSHLHLEQSEKLLNMGLAVLVEKPHRLPKQPSKNLSNILKIKCGFIQVGMTSRFNPGLQAITAAVKNGALGEILSYSDRYYFQLKDGMLSDWYFQAPSAGGGVLLTNGVHLIDRCQWVLDINLNVTSSKCTKIFKTHSQEDFASVQGTAGKTHVHLSLLWTPTETPQSELVIIGTKGTAEFSEHGWKISTFDFEQSGPAISQEKQFETQWINFRGKLLGEIPLSTKDPDFHVLEKTLKQIENIYDNEDTK
ncbi:MAG: Gfo/Idh/MocA family oxidoreductase [Paracoccaceae bacterium]|nr:Gfo/Idh/MocA family oxidoreductase [Paracoccaceae bacterium]